MCAYFFYSLKSNLVSTCAGMPYSQRSLGSTPSAFGRQCAGWVPCPRPYPRAHSNRACSSWRTSSFVSGTRQVRYDPQQPCAGAALRERRACGDVSAWAMAVGKAGLAHRASCVTTRACVCAECLWNNGREHTLWSSWQKSAALACCALCHPMHQMPVRTC